MGLGSLWMILATAVMNLSMVAYWRIMSQGLGDGYSELFALSAVTNILGVLTLGASTTLVKAFAEDEAAAGPSAAAGRLKAILPMIAKAMLVSALLLGLATPLAVGYLKLKSATPYFLVAGSFVLGLGLLAVRSAVQGTQRFGALGLSLSSEGLGRAGFGFVLVGLGWGVSGALLGSLLALGLGFLACLPAVVALGPAVAPPRRSLAQGLREAGKDAGALGLFSLICFLDALMVKHQLADKPAADYGRAALVAKSFLYLASALNMVLLPAVSSARARGGWLEARRTLLKFLGGALAMELAGLAFVWGLTPFVIRLLCGGDESLQALAPLVRIFSAAVVPLALAQLVLYYLLASRDYRALALLAAVTAAYAMALQRAAGDPFHVVACLGLAAAILLALLLWAALRPSAAKEMA